MNEFLSHSDHVIINNNLFFFDDGLCLCVDLNTWRSHVITNIKNHNWVLKNGVSNSYQISESQLLLISWTTGRAAIFDFEKKSIRQVMDGKSKPVISAGVLCDGYIYLVKMSDREITKIGVDGKSTKTVIPAQYDRFIRSINECNLFFYSSLNKELCRFDFENNSFITINQTVPLKDFRIATEYLGVFYYLSDNQLFIVGNESDSVIDLPITLGEKEIGMIVPMKEYVLLLPAFGDDILKLSYEGYFKVYDEYPLDFAYTITDEWLSRCNKYSNFKMNGNCMIFPNKATNYLLTVGLDSQTLEWKRIIPPLKSEYLKEKINNSHGIINEVSCELVDYINFVVNS